MLRNVLSKNEGVSPVIGTILLVALTVVLVGIIGAVLMGFGMPEPAPIVGISIGNQGNTITVTQLNGAVLPAGSYTILVDGVDKTAEFGGDVDFGPGITLSWDSGSEAVGTVSVVYTSDKGVSTLLAEKRIGKAGGGGGGFEDKYTIIPGQKKQWAQFLDQVLASEWGLPFGNGNVYIDNGEYWVAYYGKTMSKESAASRPTIQSYVDSRPLEHIFMKIDLSNKIYNESDITTFDQPWKSPPYPVRGSLYEYDGYLYICQNAGDPTSGWTVSRDPNYDGPYNGDWLKIATINS